MNKADLLKELERTLGSRKAAVEALDSVVDTIVREIARGGKVAITGFGTFDRVDRAARTGRNPHTGAAVRIPKGKSPRFRPGTAFKDYVRKPSSLPKSEPATGRAPAGSGTAATTTKKATAKRATATKAGASTSAARRTTAKKAGTATKSAATATKKAGATTKKAGTATKKAGATTTKAGTATTKAGTAATKADGAPTRKSAPRKAAKKS